MKVDPEVMESRRIRTEANLEITRILIRHDLSNSETIALLSEMLWSRTQRSVRPRKRTEQK